MNHLTDLFLIDGKPMLVPDAGVEMSFEDLDSEDSGRDEGGFMHRIVVRYKLGVWSFTYSYLTGEEYAYMLSILPKTGSFDFTHPKLSDSSRRETTRAYLSGYGIAWQSARTGQYRNLKFSITQC